MNKTMQTVAMLIAVGVMSGCGGKNDGKKAVTLADIPLSIRVKTVELQKFEQDITVQGSLSSDKFTTVAARTGGNLDEVYVDFGDVVKKGETTLFSIDATQLKNKLLIAERSVDTAKAQVLVAKVSVDRTIVEQKKAQLDFERYSRLHKDGRVSDNEFEQISIQKETLDASVAIAQANVELYTQQQAQAEVSLAIAQRDLADSTVVAPIDGVISARMQEPGSEMKVGTPIVTVHGVNVVRAIAFLPGDCYADVIPGETEFRLTVDGEARGAFKVLSKSPVVDMTLRTFEIRGLIENQEWAVPGKMASFDVVFSSHEGIAVPDEAILARRAGHVAFVEENGKVREVVVKTGLRSNGFTEVIEGIQVGDKVIVEGQTQVAEGRKVQVVQ